MARMTISEIAAHVGVHKSTVSRQVRKAGIVGADGKVDLEQYQALREQGIDPMLQTTGRAAGGGGEPEDGSFAAERRRKMAADATLAELELGRQRGDLVPAAAAEATQEDIARRLRDRILQVPREIAADCAKLGEERAIEATVTAALKRAMDDFAQELQTNALGRAA